MWIIFLNKAKGYRYYRTSAYVETPEAERWTVTPTTWSRVERWPTKEGAEAEAFRLTQKHPEWAGNLGVQEIP